MLKKTEEKRSATDEEDSFEKIEYSDFAPPDNPKEVEQRMRIATKRIRKGVENFEENMEKLRKENKQLRKMKHVLEVQTNFSIFFMVVAILCAVMCYGADRARASDPNVYSRSGPIETKECDEKTGQIKTFIPSGRLLIMLEDTFVTDAPNDLAKQIGLKEGDEILEVCGKDTVLMTNDELHDALQRGKRAEHGCEVVFRRNPKGLMKMQAAKTRAMKKAEPVLENKANPMSTLLTFLVVFMVFMSFLRCHRETAAASEAPVVEEENEEEGEVDTSDDEEESESQDEESGEDKEEDEEEEESENDDGQEDDDNEDENEEKEEEKANMDELKRLSLEMDVKTCMDMLTATKERKEFASKQAGDPEEINWDGHTFLGS